jgi:TBC1 domain family member 15
MGGGPPEPSTSFTSNLSTHSSESMVEIVQHPPAETPGEHRLLYSKSKVYVHPSAFTRDNIPGFVGIVKKVSFKSGCYFGFGI